ncbi:MAG: energy transducer TonB [Bacteroidetes bacterium]|nr:energy transducer TonB [Bacteroidota bacterium]
MKKEKKDKHFIHKPIYEGGLKAMRQFISKNMQYPEKAKEHKIEGTVVIRYTINFKGKVVETKVVKSLDPECDQEAVRLVKLLRFYVPKNRKKKLKFHKRIQIHFRLPKEKPQEKISEISYTVTPAKKEEGTPKKEDKSGGYTIFIN